MQLHDKSQGTCMLQCTKQHCFVLRSNLQAYQMVNKRQRVRTVQVLHLGGHKQLKLSVNQASIAN